MTNKRKIKTEEADRDQAKREEPFAIYFVRHAQAVESPDGQRSLDDPPLSALGVRQAVRIARRLQTEKFDHVYSSPLTRARLTAEAILRFYKGEVATQTREIMEVAREHFVHVPDGFHPATPQALDVERDAMMRFSNRIRLAHHPGQKILVVAHGNLIRSLMPILGGRNPRESLLIEVNNASLSILDVWQSGAAVLRLGNCVKHLLTGEVTS